MSFTEIVVNEEVQLENAVLLEGLPGVGNVGKLATAHLIAELGATKCTEIYSSHFPPQVLIEESGEVRLVNNELFYWRGKDGARLAIPDRRVPGHGGFGTVRADAETA